MSRFFIKEGYVERTSVPSWDDTSCQDESQRLIYEFADKVFKENNLMSVLDVGCGSGYKLIKHFAEYKTLGIDVPKTVTYLKEKYPDREWSDVFEPVQGYDLLICSDVVEHFEDSDILMEMIKKCNPKYLVISTPDRTYRSEQEKNGPPAWEYHFREWDFKEFHDYISSHFDVIEHSVIPHECSQYILAKIKS